MQLVRPGSADHSRIVVRLIKYLEKDWSCKTSIPADPQENSIWSFESYDSTSEMSFSLGVHYEDKKGTLQLSLYCPFWMVNKTGLMLSYRVRSYDVKVKMSFFKNYYISQSSIFFFFL